MGTPDRATQLWLAQYERPDRIMSLWPKPWEVQVDPTVSFLKTTQLFARAPMELVQDLSSRFETLQLAAGSELFRDGDPGGSFYFVVDGLIELRKGGVGFLVRGAGDPIGEFAFLDGRSRSATAVARVDCKLLRWTGGSLEDLLSAHPGLDRFFLHMLVDNLRVESNVLAQASRLQQDLRRAAEIQSAMLPTGEARLGDLEISGYCQPAESVGGDYYDYLSLDASQAALIVGDVMGHGFYSALLVAMAKSCVHTHAVVGFEPSRVLRALNRIVHQTNQGIQRRNHTAFLMTCVVITLNTSEDCLEIANAGHCHPLLYRSSYQEIAHLGGSNLLLGVPGFDAIEFRSETVGWHPGDCLIVVSDGILEARDSRGEEFGRQALEEAILRVRDMRAVEIQKSILEAVEAHRDGGTPEDDMTIAVARFQPALCS